MNAIDLIRNRIEHEQKYLSQREEDIKELEQRMRDIQERIVDVRNEVRAHEFTIDALNGVISELQHANKASVDMEALMKLVHGNRKIEAIKQYRELTGFGLKEAKDVIESYYQRWMSSIECLQAQ